MRLFTSGMRMRKAKTPTFGYMTAPLRVSRASTASLPLVRTVRAKLLVDGDHYDDLVARGIGNATVSVWISTANLKTMLVEAPVGTRARARGQYISFFEKLGDLARRGV